MAEQDPKVTLEEQKFKIKVQGQEKEVPLNELLELAQKGDDYTKKTQELSAKEAKMAEDTQKKAEELAFDYLEQVKQEEANKPKPIDENLDPQEQRIQKLERELETVKQGSEKQVVAQYELEYETKLRDCKSKYPEMNEKVVLATLSANPELNMESLSKESHEGRISEKDNWIKEYLEKKKKQPRTENGGPSSAPISPTRELTAKDLSNGEVRKQASEAIRQEMEQ